MPNIFGIIIITQKKSESYSQKDTRTIQTLKKQYQLYNLSKEKTRTMRKPQRSQNKLEKLFPVLKLQCKLYNSKEKSAIFKKLWNWLMRVLLSIKFVINFGLLKHSQLNNQAVLKIQEEYTKKHCKLMRLNLKKLYGQYMLTLKLDKRLTLGQEPYCKKLESECRVMMKYGLHQLDLRLRVKTLRQLKI